MFLYHSPLIFLEISLLAYVHICACILYLCNLYITSIDKSKQKSEADNVCERIYNVIKVHVYVCERKKEKVL